MTTFTMALMGTGFYHQTIATLRDTPAKQFKLLVILCLQTKYEIQTDVDIAGKSKSKDANKAMN